jgi:hypothetical protein
MRGPFSTPITPLPGSLFHADPHNLLAAIVIHWNTARLGEAVTQRQRAKLPVPPDLLAHTSPLSWAHILLTGEYKWPKR